MFDEVRRGTGLSRLHQLPRLRGNLTWRRDLYGLLHIEESGMNREV